jgi:hypothetical protein
MSIQASETSTAPTPADFSADTREGEYEARFRVTGEVHVQIKASSLEDARRQAFAMLDDERFGLELDGVDEVEVDRVFKAHTMYRVIREGREMQVSHLLPGDLPRDPDERGF